MAVHCPRHALALEHILFHIRPAKNAFQRVLSLFDAHLLRSAKCFLDIDIHFYDTEIDLAPYLSRLAVHASRWRRLSISAYFPQLHMDALKELFCTADAPVLEHLSLTMGPSEIEMRPLLSLDEYPGMDGTILTRGAPALSFVRLGGYAIGQMHPPLHLITTLHLDNWMRQYITPNEMARVLASVPRIVNLSLTGIIMLQMSHDLTVFPQAVMLPHAPLRGDEGAAALVPRFLLQAHRRAGSERAHTRAPASAYVPWGPFGFTLLPSVRHITLDGDGFQGPRLVKLLARTTPNVVSVKAEKTVSAILKSLRPRGKMQVPPWPALRTLELRDMVIGDVPYLCNLVLMLQSIGGLGKGGLSKISLDRRGREAIRAENRLDWLKEHVEVAESDEREF